MNYLAHALPHLHDPWLVAGTSLPDWLRFVRVRLQANRLLIAPELLSLPAHSPAARLRAGALHHHEDDRRFHADARFEALTTELARELRALEADPRFRASTIAHVLIEILVDAALLRSHPGSAERYYEALASLDAAELREAAQVLAGEELARLPLLQRRFLEARFLLAYRTDDGVLASMDAVLRRTGLPEAPAGTLACIEKARPSVETLTAALFPP